MSTIAVQAAPGPAQTPGDTLSRVVASDTVRVEASRIGLRLRDLATSAQVLSTAQLRQSSARSLQDVLARIPGAHVLDLSGSDTHGQVEARGFASQGTSSHVLVLVDEMPVNDFETERVDWNLLGLSQVGSIEFLRGASSFLYGNASMAGVVNLSTRRDPRLPRFWFSGDGGSEGRGGASAGWFGGGGGRELWLSAGYQSLDGFRDHSAWRAASGYFRAIAPLGSAWKLGTRGLFQQTRQEVPGPVPAPTWKDRPQQAGTPLDSREGSVGRAGLDVTGSLPWSGRLVAALSGDVRALEATETIVPVGTLDRSSDSRTLKAEARAEFAPAWRAWSHLLVGADLVHGVLESRYRDPGSAGALVGAGDVDRLSGGAFALAELRPAPAWRLTGGVRLDWLRSGVDDPTDGSPRGGDDDLRAVSPTLSANVTWPEGGSAYASFAGAFKAPTLEQLYDQRPFDLDGPGPAPPMRLSSNVLQPQRGDHFEVGARVPFPARVHTSVAVYYARSRDEIGFDLSNFRYDNIERSIHAGLEIEIAAAVTSGLDVQAAYALTRATFDGGSHDGNQINTVPMHQVSGRIDLRHPYNGAFSVEALGVAEQWADEENRHKIEPYSVLHLGLTQRMKRAELFASVRNVFERHYATLAFVTIDPATFAELPLYYPGTRRSFQLGVRFGMTP